MKKHLCPVDDQVCAYCESLRVAPCPTCTRPANAGYRSPGGHEQCADACHDAFKCGADLRRAIKCRKAIAKRLKEARLATDLAARSL